MDETYLLTIETVVQVGDDLLILPTLSADKYCLVGFDRIKLVKPDGQVVEMNVEVAIPFSRPENYWILIPDAKKEDVPVRSQIWIK